ncbi:hypothetical protein LLG10_03090 [bacterium]|nr:hypothetical protein [bacterium]
MKNIYKFCILLFLVLNIGSCNILVFKTTNNQTGKKNPIETDKRNEKESVLNSISVSTGKIEKICKLNDFSSIYNGFYRKENNYLYLDYRIEDKDGNLVDKIASIDLSENSFKKHSIHLNHFFGLNANLSNYILGTGKGCTYFFDPETLEIHHTQENSGDILIQKNSELLMWLTKTDYKNRQYNSIKCTNIQGKTLWRFPILNQRTSSNNYSFIYPSIQIKNNFIHILVNESESLIHYSLARSDGTIQVSEKIAQSIHLYRTINHSSNLLESHPYEDWIWTADGGFLVLIEDNHLVISKYVFQKERLLHDSKLKMLVLGRIKNNIPRIAFGFVRSSRDGWIIPVYEASLDDTIETSNFTHFYIYKPSRASIEEIGSVTLSGIITDFHPITFDEKQEEKFCIYYKKGKYQWPSFNEASSIIESDQKMIKSDYFFVLNVDKLAIQWYKDFSDPQFCKFAFPYFFVMQTTNNTSIIQIMNIDGEVVHNMRTTDQNDMILDFLILKSDLLIVIQKNGSVYRWIINNDS